LSERELINDFFFQNSGDAIDIFLKTGSKLISLPNETIRVIKFLLIFLYKIIVSYIVSQIIWLFSCASKHYSLLKEKKNSFKLLISDLIFNH